jgi:hypothetical protein
VRASIRVNRWTTLLALALPALGLSAQTSSGAAGPTRAEYIQRIEPICQARTQASRTVLRNVDEMVRDGQLQAAARRFERAADALEGAIHQVARVPRPVADQARLVRWLDYGKEGDALLRRIAKGLGEGDRHRVQGMSGELLTTAKRGNAIVVGFGFKYCRLNPSRFA